MQAQRHIIFLGVLGTALLPVSLWAGALDPRPLGEEFCLLADGSSPPRNTHFVVELGDRTESFVLAYNRAGVDELLARIFDREGAPVGPEIILDEPFVGSQSWTDDLVSDPPSGRWLAVWHGDGSPGGDNSLTSVKARLFDAAGSPLVLSFQANTTEPGIQTHPKATFLADGRFVVVFQDRPITPISTEVRARVFDATGVPLGGDFLVTAGLIEGSSPDVVASPLGGFFVV